MTSGYDLDRAVARNRMIDARSRTAVAVLDGLWDPFLRDGVLTPEDLGLCIVLKQSLLRELTERVHAIDGRWGRTYASRHEMASVLREEFEEAWDVVKTNGPDERLREELIDVGVVVLRALRQLDEDAAIHAVEPATKPVGPTPPEPPRFPILCSKLGEDNRSDCVMPADAGGVFCARHAAEVVP